MDPKDQLIRFLFGTSAETQEKMNDYYIGGVIHIANFYSNVANTVFVAVFYMAILPSGVAVALAGLMLNFACLKFMLLRRWKPQAQLSSRMAKLVLKFTHLAVFMHVFFTRAAYASWPFDSTCIPSNTTNGMPLEQGYYESCDKDTFRIIYWMSRRPWHDENQWFAVNVFNQLLTAMFTGLVVTGIVAAPDFLKTLFRSNAKTDTSGSSHLYHSVKDVESYIPALKHRSLLYPALAADVSSEKFSAHLLPSTVVNATAIQKQTGHPVPRLYEYFEKEMLAQGISTEVVLPDLGTLTIMLERSDVINTGATPEAGDMQLKITIVRAAGLVAMDFAVGKTNSSDPFCRIYRGFESVGVTTTKMKTLSPEWGEVFLVDFEGVYRGRSLGMTVIDYDFISGTGAGDFLGKLTIPAHDWEEAYTTNTRQERTYKLMPHFSLERVDRFFSPVKGYGKCAGSKTEKLSETGAEAQGGAQLSFVTALDELDEMEEKKEMEARGKSPIYRPIVNEVEEAKSKSPVCSLESSPALTPPPGVFCRPVSQSPYATAVADAANSHQLLHEDSGFTYTDSTGTLPEEVTLQISANGFAILPAASTGLRTKYHAAMWADTEVEAEKSADPQFMEMFRVTFTAGAEQSPGAIRRFEFEVHSASVLLVKAQLAAVSSRSLSHRAGALRQATLKVSKSGLKGRGNHGHTNSKPGSSFVSGPARPGSPFAVGAQFGSSGGRPSGPGRIQHALDRPDDRELVDFRALMVEKAPESPSRVMV
jgi:hypothetical protein